MRLSAKADYALRAMVELAAHAGEGAVKGERIASAQTIPPKFLESIMRELKHAGLVKSQRGSEGGYQLARPPGEITMAAVIRVVEGPLASVRGERPEGLAYEGAAEALGLVWIAVRANLRAILEAVTLADLVAGELPPSVVALTEDEDAWAPH